MIQISNTDQVTTHNTGLEERVFRKLMEVIIINYKVLLWSTMTM